MPLADMVMAGLKFDSQALAQVGNDDNENGNALIMLIIPAVLAAILGATGQSLAPVSLGTEDKIALVIGNLFFSLFFTFVYAWIFAFSARIVGAQASTMQAIRVLGASQIWPILGYLIAFAGVNLSGLLGLIGLIVFLIGMGAATGKGVGSMIVAWIIAIILVMILFFVVVVILVLSLLGLFVAGA